MFGVEHGRFRRDLNLRLRGEGVLRVAKRREFVPILTFMLANFCGRSGLARVDQPEGNLGFIARANLLNQRRVPIGNGAVRAQKNEDHRFSRSCQKRIGRSPIEMERRLLSGQRKGQSEKEKRRIHEKGEDHH